MILKNYINKHRNTKKNNITKNKLFYILFDIILVYLIE